MYSVKEINKDALLITIVNFREVQLWFDIC